MPFNMISVMWAASALTKFPVASNTSTPHDISKLLMHSMEKVFGSENVGKMFSTQ